MLKFTSKNRFFITEYKYLVFGYKQKGLGMKEFNEKNINFNEIDDYNYRKMLINAMWYSFQKRCNQLNDYILSLPDEDRKRLEKMKL